jgi:hypothetical protein
MKIKKVLNIISETVKNYFSVEIDAKKIEIKKVMEGRMKAIKLIFVTFLLIWTREIFKKRNCTMMNGKESMCKIHSRVFSLLKKSRISTIGFILILLLPKLGMSEHYSNVFGRVIDEETKQGITGLSVTIVNIEFEDTYENLQTKTNNLGEFKFTGLPVEAEFTIHVQVTPRTIPYNRYFVQEHYIPFTLQKGKNLTIPDIIMKKGVQIKGKVQLWDGTVINKPFFVTFELEKSVSNNPDLIPWGTAEINNGCYISDPLPYNEEFIIHAFGLRNAEKNIDYGEFRQKIVLKEGQIPESIDVVIPNIQTEIKGQVKNKNGVPLKNQNIHLFIGESAETNEMGLFTFRHIQPGDIILHIVPVLNNKVSGSFLTNQFILNNGESIWFDIVVDENEYFFYKLTRNPYQE